MGFKSGENKDIEVQLSYEFNKLSEVERQTIVKEVKKLISNYNSLGEIEYIEIDYKGVEPAYFGNMVFCKINLSTPHLIICEYGGGWNINSAVENALKRALSSTYQATQDYILGKCLDGGETAI